MKLVSSFFSFMNGLYYFSIPLIFSPEWVFMTPPPRHGSKIDVT